MKQIIKIQILCVLSLVIILTGCDDFLDKLPENTVEAESVDYSKINEMYMPVSGMYASARETFGSWSAYGLIAVRGDDVNKGSTATDQIEYQYCKDFKYDMITGYWALNGTWSGLYKMISTANAAIESLDKYAEFITADADRQKYNEYLAEVRFLRALAYFRIVNFWGDAPLLLDNQQLNIEKSTKDEIYTYIFDELEFCISNLPALRPNEQAGKLGAVTKYTAIFLKAKAAMYNNDWDTVLSGTQEIISSSKFSLYSDFYELFKIPGKLSDESLFEIQLTDFNTGSGEIIKSDNWFAFQGPRGGQKPIEGWGFMVPSDEIRAYFDARGETVRKTTTFLVAGETTPSGDKLSDPIAGEPTAYSGKAYTPSNQMTEGRNDYGDNNNVRMFRYADVLLMNAEAKIRKGENGDVPLNEVRARAEIAPISGATVDDVLNERRVEFALEWGERFFDLVRTGKAATTLPGFVEGESNYYPIPSDQIDLNPNLK